MMHGYIHEADDVYINLNLNTQMELPSSRDTLLHFFEQMRKAYPDMANFQVRETGDLVLEGDKDAPSYRWVAIEPRRLCSGQVNPPSPESAYRQHATVLEVAPHLLSLSSLDCEALDVMYGFDFSYGGNHDEVVAEALGVPSTFEGLLDLPGSRIINFEPNLTLSLDDSCRLQCRIAIETRTNVQQLRLGESSDEQISVYFTVRQYCGGMTDGSLLDSFRRQCTVAEEMLAEKIIPRIVRPLAATIASK